MITLRWLTWAVLDRAPIRRQRKQRRGPVRDWRYRAFVREHRCATCRTRRYAIDAAHTGSHGIGQKASDMSTVPLCRCCHNLLHKIGPEAFQRLFQIKFSTIINQLHEEWKETQERSREEV